MTTMMAFEHAERLIGFVCHGSSRLRAAGRDKYPPYSQLALA
jgi:hypothetical protein